MHKFLKLSTVSMLAVMAATGANAAGYTCEELIEYTSCNPGYYLSGHDECNGEDYPYYLAGLCEIESGTYKYGYTEAACTTEGGTYYPGACFDGFDGMGGWDSDGNFFASQNCIQCQPGTSCAGGIADWQYCRGGTYQPNAGQSSCLLTPAGTYTEDFDIKWTKPIKCEPGSYQPEEGQIFCEPCPAGSYCETEGLAQPTDVCPIGSFAAESATECTSCPASGLTDINGAVVNATTLSTGSTSVTACIIGPESQFKDTKGTYHFKSDCSYSPDRYPAASIDDCKEGYSYILTSDLSLVPDDLQGSEGACVRVSQAECNENNNELAMAPEEDLSWENGHCMCAEYWDLLENGRPFCVH